jgi:hypothetical protein
MLTRFQERERLNNMGEGEMNTVNHADTKAVIMSAMSVFPRPCRASSGEPTSGVEA